MWVAEQQDNVATSLATAEGSVYYIKQKSSAIAERNHFCDFYKVRDGFSTIEYIEQLTNDCNENQADNKLYIAAQTHVVE